MSAREMRKSALRRYVLFRIEAMEFLDLNTLRNTLNANQIDPVPHLRPALFMSDSVRTVVLCWFALFVTRLNCARIILPWSRTRLSASRNL